MGQLNIELFKKIRDRIATIPESYDQNYWKRHESTSPCGTAACLAGETIICDASTVEEGIARLEELEARSSPDDPRQNPMDFDSAVPVVAAEKLGLSPRQHGIFLGGAAGWPEPFRSLFRSALPGEQKAHVAVAYLDHIIETGKVLE